jgi:hypothetical protein
MLLGTRTWRVTYYVDREFLTSRQTFSPYTLLIVLTLLVFMVLVGACGAARWLVRVLRRACVGALALGKAGCV